MLNLAGKKPQSRYYNYVQRTKRKHVYRVIKKYDNNESTNKDFQ